jgi:hypothetical protein
LLAGFVAAIEDKPGDMVMLGNFMMMALEVPMSVGSLKVKIY